MLEFLYVILVLPAIILVMAVASAIGGGDVEEADSMRIVGNSSNKDGMHY